jgi:hypothetical protein
VSTPSWWLRHAEARDRDFLYALHEATMRAHVERIWGWDDSEQLAFFDNRFEPGVWQVIQAEGVDVGVLILQDTTTSFTWQRSRSSPRGRAGGSVQRWCVR